MRHFSVPKEYEYYRLDQFLANKLPSLSRSFIQKIVKSGKASVNSAPCLKVARILAHEDKVSVEMPVIKKTYSEAEDIPLDVVYEDADLIVINKPAGLVVHPAHGNRTGTLVNALLNHCKDLSGIGGQERPGIVHRLDKDTSGLIVVAKNDASHQNLSSQFKDRRVAKRYLALVHGTIKNDMGTIDAPIGRSQSDRKKMAVITSGPEGVKSHNHRKPRRSKARSAVTHYKVVKRQGGMTLVEVKLETGRTHQIRVHMAYAGHPIVGDKVYGQKKDKSPFMALHSYALGFFHPSSGEYMEFVKEKVL